ncbi:MAG: GNAT family N-acetyltransferase [Halioglobus sp.]|nr:GNAT family N-acetyltransferase [Halioglobus sp.]
MTAETDNDRAPAQFDVQFISSINAIGCAQWDGVTGSDNPFLRHEFLCGLETTGCTSAETGWQPCHVLLQRGEELVAVMPLYLKSHSYGEYVFDWSWEDAWRRSGLDYFPKLLTAIPFTPATGPRICTAAGFDAAQATQLMHHAVTEFATRRGLSSWHLLFPEQELSERLLQLGMHQRPATQFHWFNDGYASFDDFLSTFNSRKRKSLRRERRRVAEQGLSMTTLRGADIEQRHWHQFYRFYQLTYAKRSGHGGYLTEEFFLDTAPRLGDQVVMFLAHLGGRAVAGALCFHGNDTLYGRYWGCEQEFDCLHFEACYYQGIDYCIANGLSRFDPGPRGEHKIQRGFKPVTTWSNHWIADPRLDEAVGDFTRREAAHIEHYRQSAAQYLPFKQSL